jgi:hypothetical protein
MERRSFLKNAAAAAPFIGQTFGAGDEIRIAQIGLGTRGAYELEVCQRTKGAKVLAVADVYRPLVDKWPRCPAAGETGLKIDPACQEAHVENFLACVRSRRRPVADVEIGHRSISPCHVGNIAYRLGRKVKWDVAAQTFPADAEARAMMTKKYRAPWVLPAV